MGLVKPKKLYEHAIKNNYGLGAFNTFSIESILAVMDAAEAQRSPAIIQVSMGTREYVRHLKTYVDVIKELGKHYKMPFFIQHDHCSTVEACIEAIDSGVQAVMFDGSHMSYEENLEKTSKIVEYARPHDIWVEAEIGCLPGFEDMIFAEKTVYTNPKLASAFIKSTGCNSLAVSVGTSHGGVVGTDYLPMDFELLHAIISENPEFPYVLHGAASLPPKLIKDCNDQGGGVEYLRNCSEESIATAVKMGVRKVNMDVDNFLTFTTAVRGFLNQHPHIYDPRKYLSSGKNAFKAEIEHKMKTVLDSSERY